MTDYIIFSDVSIDIEQAFAQANGIRYVPMEYLLGTETHRCDRPESNEKMHIYYDKLREKIPTRTSQITPYHYVSVFEPYIKEGKSILYISLSGGLSDTCDSARMAAATLMETYPAARIEVVDSLGATGGMGLLAECACRNRDQGMSLADNASWLREHAANVNYWFMVEDLMYLKRGGRVSAATAVVGTALNIKPILIINGEGKLDTVAKKRGNRQAYRHMIDQMEQLFDPSICNEAYICCADCLDEAAALRAMVEEKFPGIEVKITMLSPIIGAHTGPGMISLIFFGKKRD